MDLTIDTHELDAMARTYANAAPIVRDELTKGMTRLVVMGQGFAREEAPVDRGRLRASIAHEVVARGQDIVGRFGTNISYGESVEIGGSMPGNDMDGWGPRHGFASDAQAAAIIRWKGGSAPHPYLRPAFDRVKNAVAGVMQAALRAVLARIGGGR